MQITSKGQVTIPRKFATDLAFCRIRRSSSSWLEIMHGFARLDANPAKAREVGWYWRLSAGRETCA